MRIDVHSHILPGIDDGSSSVKESLQMLKMEAEQGITHVIATPHFYAKHDTPERFLRRRERAYDALTEAMQGHSDLPQITLGAEVYYFWGISETEMLSALTIGGGSYILLEMPDVEWSDSMFKEIEQIYDRQGITPILAHIERYITPFNANRVLRRLSDLPVMIQSNASFFLRLSTRSRALSMLRREQIHLLGSDCHGVTERQPNLGSAYQVIQSRLGEKTLDILDHYGKSILQGSSLK